MPCCIVSLIVLTGKINHTLCTYSVFFFFNYPTLNVGRMNPRAWLFVFIHYTVHSDIIYNFHLENKIKFIRALIQKKHSAGRWVNSSRNNISNRQKSISNLASIAESNVTRNAHIAWRLVGTTKMVSGSKGSMLWQWFMPVERGATESFFEVCFRYRESLIF